MPAFTKSRVPTCCGNFATSYVLGFPLRIEHRKQFENAGFVFNASFLAAGMLYMEIRHYIVVGKLGSNVVQIKCKTPKCDAETTSFEEVCTALYGA